MGMYLGVKAMKDRTTEMEPHHRMVFSVIPRI